MRILIRWDDAAQAELISLYLGAGEHETAVALEPDEFRRYAAEQDWSIVLFSTSAADPDATFKEFEEFRQVRPDCPVIGACRSDDVFRVARYLTHGMRSYVLRDAGGDFVFLLQSILESTMEGVRAEREQKLAERLREEVDSVRRLQESIIPRDIKTPKDYSVCARYESSQIRVLGGRPVVMAGGDYYDAFRVDEDHLVLLLGDASGHGMKACMSIMTMHTLIGMLRSDEYQNTAAFVAEVNRRLCGQQIVSDEGGFITILFGILDGKTHTFQWTSAGHPIPLLHNLESNHVEPLGTNDDGGLPLGILDDAEYEFRVSTIPPNSRLLLYTDGLAEAFPESGDGHGEFGEEGIKATLRKSRSRPIDEALQALFDDSTAFTQGTGRHDDTSALLLERA